MIEAKEEISEFVESEDGIIINLFWSNEEGWTSFFLADSFTKEEYFEFNLPEGGIWVEVSKVFNLVASDDTFLITEISKIKRNPVVYPDSFDDETNFRVI
jgi:hypothetical protein